VLDQVETVLNAAAARYGDAATTQLKASYTFANAVAGGIPVSVDVNSKGGRIVTG
jgi:hypothetical protein